MSKLRIVATLLTLAPAASAQTLLVSSYTQDSVYQLDAGSGALTGSLGSVPGAQSIVYGPDGDLYIVSEKSDEVLRFDGQTGASLGVFVGDDPLTPEDESGGLDAPTSAIFGPTGDLLVASFSGDSILRYDGTTGAFLDVFVDPGDGMLNGPDAGMAIGPDGLLWVPSFENNRVLRYDATTGDFVDKVIPASSGLRNPRVILFRSDGMVYVSSWGTNSIQRFDLNGNLLDTFATSLRPTGMVFEPGTGHLLVCSDNADFIHRFDAVTGAALPDVLAPGGPLASATFLTWMPDPSLRLSRLDPGSPGINSLQVAGATPSSGVVLLAGVDPLSIYLETCAALWLGLNPLVSVFVATDADGVGSTLAPLGPGSVGVTLRLSAYDPNDCRLSNLVVQVVE